jgi:hypothetical protein
MSNRKVITSQGFAPDQPTLHNPKDVVIEVVDQQDRLTLNELTPHILAFELLEQKTTSYGIHKLVVAPSERITAEAVRELWAREHAVQKGYVIVLYGYYPTAADGRVKETTAE